MSAVENPGLLRFHPIVRDWFSISFGNPTEIQEKAWESVERGDHCLISAATGSGKTLAAFLWAIDRLLRREWELGSTRVLYISPLKALNNDIQKNLLGPLEALKMRFEEAGESWPEIHVKTRSGDTEQGERRRMLRRPPEILITTPESLNLLLASRDGQRALLGIQSVILDEVHAVVGNKRGVYLMSALERLARINGEFQRIALSATVNPMEMVSRFVGGKSRGVERPVQRVFSDAGKRYEIAITLPSEERDEEDPWLPIAKEIYRLIQSNRSTLVFVNSRMLSEKLCHKLNTLARDTIAYSHHGSLSREIRETVERRLKEGQLKAIVATSSLEMGIDIGELDCVVLVKTPGSVSSAIQKLGRSGHQVGAVSRGTLYPWEGRDLLESVVLGRLIRDRAIEPVRAVEAPLDVLAQTVVACLGARARSLDEIFKELRDCYSFRNLRREHFDLVVDMLAGRYASARLRELKPRISIDRTTGIATLRKGALLAFYLSGGVIADRGYFHLRTLEGDARLGELDEEFVWERKVGDVFTLGTQTWRIDKITYNDVFVSPGRSEGVSAPFWRAEQFDRDFHFSRAISSFLEELEEAGREDEMRSMLEGKYSLSGRVADQLLELVRRQREITGSALPHRTHVLVERVQSGPKGAPGQQVILHTGWGGRVNRPFALALDEAISQRFGYRSDLYANNDCVVIQSEGELVEEELLSLVNLDNLDGLLRQRLEGSGFFGARFREAAGISLLITRNRAGQRLPLWMSRMRAKRLLESVRRFEDFPLMLEAWRSCLRDEFDMDSLREVLREIELGTVEVSFCRTKVASPFAANVSWRQINDEYMYATDEASGDRKSHLSDDLIGQIAFGEEALPAFEAELIEEFEAKRQGRSAGYEPRDALELREWLRDRIVVSEEEWRRMSAFSDGRIEVLCDGLKSVVYLEEEREKVEHLFSGEEGAVLEFLGYFGPFDEAELSAFLGIGHSEFGALIDSLVDDRKLVRGAMVAESDRQFICEAENFEILLRMRRARNRPVFEALPLEQLPLFLANWQGLVDRRGEGQESVEDCFVQLFGVAGSIQDWEKAWLPARIERFTPALLDAAVAGGGLQWYGGGRQRILFGYEGDLDLMPEVEFSETELTLEAGVGYGFSKLQEISEVSADVLEERLWEAVWSRQIRAEGVGVLRRASLAGYRLSQSGEAIPRTMRHRGRTRLPIRSRSLSYPGIWYKVEPAFEASELDVLESLEKQKERARILLDRYGVLFREVLLTEDAGFRWRDVFKALRLMELSGEVVAGQFFLGIEGLQFATQRAVNALRKGFPNDQFFWLAANDPASACGMGLAELQERLPRRIASNFLVYRGAELLLVISKGGKALAFSIEESSEHLESVLSLLGEIWKAQHGAMMQIGLEEINGTNATGSPYLEGLESAFRLHVDYKRVVIEGVR